MPFQDDNPFASAAEPSGAPDVGIDGALPPVEVELGAILSRVGENLQRFTLVTGIVAGILLGFFFVSIPVNMMVSVGTAVAVVALGLPDELGQLGSVPSSMLQALVNSVVLVGAYRAFLTGVRGGEPSASLLFSEVWAALKMIVASLLISSVTLVLLLPAMGAGLAAYLGHLELFVALGVAAANVLLLVPVSFFLAVFTQFLGLVLVDQQLGPVGALLECWRLTQGFRVLAGVLVLGLGMLGGVVSLFTCGLGAPLAVVVGAWVRLVMYRGMVAVNGRSPSSLVAEAV